MNSVINRIRIDRCTKSLDDKSSVDETYMFKIPDEYTAGPNQTTPKLKYLAMFNEMKRLVH